jgi:hemoglobin/transferrin/lactoferrin receptor protein
MTKFTFSLFVIAFLFIQPARSESTSDSIKSKQIKEITVYSTLYKNLALPMVIVDKTNLEATSFFSAADELQRETGISIARDGIWATSVNIRGLSEQRLLFMVDGDRIQTASDHAAALSTIDLGNLDKIEVIKGASSVLYGTGAMGGVVNFVSERPKYSKTFISNGKIGTEFNTVNNLWGNNANIQFTNNQWYLSLNGSFRTAQDIKTPAGILPHSNFNDASWGLKAGIKYTPNQEFLVNYQHVGAWDVGLPGGRSFPATAAARYVGVERNQLSGEYIISDINFNLREIKIKAYTQNISRDVEVKPNASTILLPGSLNKTSGAKVTSEWRFTDYHLLTLGAEGWLRDAQTYRLTVKTTSDTTVVVTGDQPSPKAEMLDLGVFAHYSWKIIPRKLTLNAGIRLDYIQTKNDSSFNRVFQYKVTNGGTPVYVKNLTHSTLFESGVKPELSYAAHIDITYNLSTNQQLALSVANSYRAASIEERFKYIALPEPKHFGNPNLRPEKGTFSNLNYTVNNNRFRLKTDIFVNYLMDLITDIFVPYTYLNESGISTTEQAFVNTNVNNALFVGAELEAKWYIDNNLSVFANASYTRARDLDTQTFLPQIPPLHGFAAVNYLLENKFEASVSALWALRQAEIAATETPTDGSIIFNLDIHSAKIALNKSFLQLYAGVNNILNTAYYNHLSSTRGVIKLEPGRNIFVKVKWGW